MPGDFDLVKDRVDIVQLIGERVSLRKAGKSYVGLCPFHNEKTPSFHVDPDRKTYKCFGCLPPGSLVKTSQGIRQIEDVRPGDLVFAGDGRLHRVLIRHEHQFQGSLVKITGAPFKVPIVLTPDHKLPIRRPRSRRIEVVEAGSIRPQNCVLYPKVVRTVETINWSVRPQWTKTRGPRAKPLPNGVATTLFAEWLGWYLAEGSVSQDRTVRFSLSQDELDVAARLQQLSRELFSEMPRIDARPKGTEVWFCHALLARWLKHHCGAGAHRKHLPSFVWEWSSQDQWHLFRALVQCDGHIQAGGTIAGFGRPATDSWRLSSASPTLVDDVRDLLMANGVVPAVTETHNAKGRTYWHVTVSKDVAGRWAEGHVITGPIPSRIRKVERIDYSGPVYNLTVDSEHTYLTMSGTVNNCGEGGDVFSWLEKVDGLEPVEALRTLADRAGVELTRRAPEEREGQKRLLAAHETAHFYFREALRKTEAGKAAAAYIAERGITPETADRFGLGYAPESYTGLLGYLTKKGFTEEEVVTSGLISKTERGLADRFRHRVMIPIRDARGKIIAFAGRALRAEQRGKYVNSPQTPLFSKSATLFALDLARPAMRKTGEAVIVEGQFDAIACHQAGFANVVASQGTALTEGQYHVLEALKLERVVVCFDADPAGERSAEARGRDLIAVVQKSRFPTPNLVGAQGRLGSALGLDVFVAVLEQGDPDELARHDPGMLRSIIANARPLFEHVIEQSRKRHDVSTSAGARRYLAEVLPLFAHEPNPMLREKYISTLASSTGVPHETIRALTGEPGFGQIVARRSLPGRPAPHGGEGSATVAAPGDGRVSEQASSPERYLIAQLLKFPEAAAHVDLEPSDFAEPDLAAMFDFMRTGSTSAFPATLAARAAAIGALAPEPATETDPVRVIEIASLRVREQSVRRRLGEARAALARAEAGDVAGMVEEMERLRGELDLMMRSRDRRTVLRGEDRED